MAIIDICVFSLVHYLPSMHMIDASRLFTSEWNTRAKDSKRDQIENNLHTKCQMNKNDVSSTAQCFLDSFEQTPEGTVDSICHTH